MPKFQLITAVTTYYRQTVEAESEDALRATWRDLIEDDEGEEFDSTETMLDEIREAK